MEHLPLGQRDRTGRARIRDAALARFTADGFQATSLKQVAEDAGVSPPLVIHHFGSKDGLRAACDEYVIERMRERQRAVAKGQVDPFQSLRDPQNAHLLRYLARTIAAPSPQVAQLIDQMVDDAERYVIEGVEQGRLTPTDDPRERAAVLVIWQMGALALNDHVKRLLGADLTGDTEGLLAWARATGKILAEGIFAEPLRQQWRSHMKTASGDEPHEADKDTP